MGPAESCGQSMSYIFVMSHIDELDLSLLRVFRALSEEKHVTRAAQRLEMTQSATSHALARLRRVLADPLFVRAPRGVVPTERARELAPEVSAVLARVDALMAPALPFHPGRLSRRFVLGGADFAEMIFLPRLVPLLQRSAPGVDLAFRPTGLDLAEELERGQHELAIGVFRNPPSRLLVKKLFEEQFVCLLRKGHPALEKPLGVEAWAGLMHVLVSPRGEGGGVVDDMLEKRKLRRRIVVRTATFLTAPLLVEASDCVTTLPRRVAEAMVKGRSLVMFPPPLKLPGFSVTMAFHERSKHDPAHAWLRDRIVEVAAKMGGPSPGGS